MYRNNSLTNDCGWLNNAQTGLCAERLTGMVFWLNHEKEANIRLKARVLVERAIKRFGFETVLELAHPRLSH